MNNEKICAEEVIIRRANRSDAEKLVEYLNVIGGQSDYLTFGAGEFGKSVEQEEEYIENISEGDNAVSLVAELNGKIVGNLNFSGGPRKRTEHAGEFGVSVLNDYWGYGIGEKLIKYLIDWSKDSKIIRKINLRVRTDNARGIKLYTKLGFIEEGTIKRDFLIDGEFYDSLMMGLPID